MGSREEQSGGRGTAAITCAQDVEHHIERRHRMSQTYRDVNRYYNPPEDMPRLGRLLTPGSYEHLLAQTRRGEMIFAYGRQAPVNYFAACHITSQSRLDEVQRDWKADPTFYAVAAEKVIPGLDTPLSNSELESLEDEPDNDI
jgi:hypothetical protein